MNICAEFGICGILYMRNLVAFLQFKKKVKNTHEGVLLLAKLQADTCYFTKIETPPRAFFTFFKL